MASTRGRLLVLGVDPFAEVRCTGFADGDCLWDLSLQRTGDDKLEGDVFGEDVDLFSWGGGGGKRSSRARVAERFSQDDASSKQPFIYSIFRSGGFAAACLQVIAKGVLDPRLPWADTCVVRLRQPVDLGHALKTVSGLLLLVPPRTPRSSGYDVYAHAVYVVICYMSLTCICLLYVSHPRTRHVICCYMLYVCDMLYAVICCYMLYVCDMLYACYMSSARGGS